MPKNDVRTRLKLRTRRLDQLTFPALPRPAVSRDEPTHDLIAWGIRLYAFTVIAHARQLAASIRVLVGKGHWPTTFPVLRCLFELGAHASYIDHKVREALKANDLKEAWHVVESANMANRYMHDQEAKASNEEPWLKPVNIVTAIQALGKHFLAEMGIDENEAEHGYSILSEFSHPNMGALSQYYQWQETDSGPVAHMRHSPENNLQDAQADMALVSAVYHVHELLRLYNKDTRLVEKLRIILFASEEAS